MQKHLTLRMLHVLLYFRKEPRGSFLVMKDKTLEWVFRLTIQILPFVINHLGLKLEMNMCPLLDPGSLNDQYILGITRPTFLTTYIFGSRIDITLLSCLGPALILCSISLLSFWDQTFFFIFYSFPSLRT